ncbi:Mu transposase C-terminal domain-containing protein [Bacillus sp. BRMEA1]|uniref:Mu transposase C-terminal domain-containing protein n=1 Tax=Neobacillus endophyticus TaxID=2738405 RepID=UPI001565DBDA|nr:Mu transposase C-terminal domain-containing protein [Neobacillus endophyticus]NRD76570.1 Mu transposase C-terminal domain-containing protein [Neobacillus endophyticus]
MVLTINMLIQYRNDPNNIERIIWIDERYDSCFLINVFDNTLPKIKKILEIEDGLVIGEVVILEDDPFNLIIREEEISEKAKTLRNESWEIINQLLSHGVINLLNSKTRSEIVKKVSEDLNVNSKKINRCLKRYWKRGMHVNALLPDFQNCGGIGVQKNSGDNKRGRPRKMEEIMGEGVNIDQYTKEKFHLGIAKFYLRQNNVTVRYAFEQTLKEYFRDVLENDPNKLPTYNQFLYWLRKNENLSYRLIKRHGKKNFELKHRPVLGSVQQEVRSPGQKVLIDSTVSDVYLCSEFDRQSIIGRGIVYFVKDIFSRMILSVHVCLEGPNFEQARIALMNMVENKVEFCQRFGIEIKEHEWSTAHLPECIVADRAELLSHASTLLTERLNIKIENSPPFRGDFKSLVEQQFAILNRQVKPILPGAIQSDFKVRGAKDYRLSSVLTLKDFMKIVILCAIHYNNNFVIENYIRDEEMIKDGVPPIPVKLFEWGMKNRAGKLRTISREQLMLMLLPSSQASVTEFGIKWNGMFYTNETALREQWFVESRFFGRKKVTITYDPRDVGIIYLHNKDKHSFERCFLLEHQSRYKEKTLEDVNYLQEIEMQTKQHKKSGLKERINLMEQVEEIVKEAEKKSKKDRINISKNQRLKNIKENRKQEIERVRKETVQVDHAPLIKKQVHEELNKADKVIDFQDDLQLLRKFQQKGLGNKDE